MTMYSPSGVFAFKSSGNETSVLPLAIAAIVLGAGIVGGRPVGTFSVISSAKPGSRVAVTITLALPPGTPSGGSILIARLNGAFSFTAKATKDCKCIGGYARPFMDCTIAALALAA